MPLARPPLSGGAARGLMLACAALSITACATKKPPPPVPPVPPPESAARGQGGGTSGYNSGGPVTSAEGRATPGSVQDFVVNAGDRVYFDFDSYSLRDDGRRVLDAQAGWLQRYPQVQVRIEGNCDERGTREYNLALGARRAEAVKSYLTAHGIGAGRITTISYGKERPLDAGGGEESYAKNRNAHTAITAGAVGGGGGSQ